MNPIDEKIEVGITGLKKSQMPPPPPSLVERMVAGEAPRRNRSRARVWALGTCSLLVIGAFAMMPRSSSAAVTLDKLVGAHQRSAVLFKVTPYWIEGSSRTPKVWIGYVKGNQWRYVQPNYEQSSDGRRILTYIPSQNTAETWSLAPGETQLGSVLGDADLGWWKRQAGNGLKLEHNVSWNGRRVDRYVVTTTSQAWGETTNTLYADPVAQRPLYAESIHTSGNGSAMRWEYLNSGGEGVLRIQLKPGTKVKDVTGQRRRSEKLPLVPSKTATGG